MQNKHGITIEVDRPQKVHRMKMIRKGALFLLTKNDGIRDYWLYDRFEGKELRALKKEGWKVVTK
ncbi:hypothetical protein [Paenisporosarcina cavernae]|uniref:Uncharacterized protein n=1 Tax=Paenisporosarcina cavernae TaxID=2320858 RepID=A0A385YWG1_9BACL|nr:hypothetical protein [Paenisporosarcina cavernae]AYC30018.1 hypothetical protein D3873_09090 [Paenisporosarcina cavernae]